jgi:hypothetical protein
MGTLGWEGEEAATDSCGTATAALPCFGQGKSDLRGSVVVVVVVVVVDVTTVVVVDPAAVVVVVVLMVVVAEVATTGSESTMGAPTRATRATTTAKPRRNNLRRLILTGRFYFAPDVGLAHQEAASSSWRDDRASLRATLLPLASDTPPSKLCSLRADPGRAHS